MKVNGKPVILEEFGSTDIKSTAYPSWFSTIINSGLTGDLIWWIPFPPDPCQWDDAQLNTTTPGNRVLISQMALLPMTDIQSTPMILFTGFLGLTQLHWKPKIKSTLLQGCSLCRGIFRPWYLGERRKGVNLERRWQLLMQWYITGWYNDVFSMLRATSDDWR